MQYNVKTFLCPVSREDTLQNRLFYLVVTFVFNSPVFIRMYCYITSVLLLA